jgi:predicted methyltransferase
MMIEIECLTIALPTELTAAIETAVTDGGDPSPTLSIFISRGVDARIRPH